MSGDVADPVAHATALLGRAVDELDSARRSLGLGRLHEALLDTNRSIHLAVEAAYHLGIAYARKAAAR